MERQRKQLRRARARIDPLSSPEPDIPATAQSAWIGLQRRLEAMSQLHPAPSRSKMARPVQEARLESKGVRQQLRVPEVIRARVLGRSLYFAVHI